MLKNHNDISKTLFIEYLAGLDIPEDLTLSYDNSSKHKKKLANPIKEYWQQVNQFLFSGGVNIDVANAQLDDPRQAFLDEVVTYNKLKNHLYSSFKNLSIHGEILVTISLTENNKYILSFYNKDEFEFEYEDGELEEVEIYTKRKKDGKLYIFKQEFYKDKIKEYPLVPVNKAADYDWEANATEKPNNYNDIPCVIIQNSLELNSERGEGDFDSSSIDMACSILLSTFDALENNHYMGDPLLQSPDPETTIDELNRKAKVLTKFDSEDGGDIKPISVNPISEQSLKLIEKLEINFKKAMGIRYSDDEPSTETSSVTLKILNSATINKAAEKWEYLVEQGFVPLLEKVLRYSYIDKNLLGFNPEDPEDYKVTFSRLKAFFPESSAEKLTKLSIVEALKEIGINPIEALKEYYPEKTSEEINELLTNRDF